MSLCRPAARADELEAVSSAVSDDYSRARLSDGSYQAETYTFGDGGRMVGPVRDDSIDQMTFMDVAKSIAGPLAHRNYVPVTDRNPENTKLLIMVYWGTTRGSGGATNSNGYQKLQAKQGSLTAPPPPPADAYTAHCSCDATQLNTNIASLEKGAKEGDISSAFALVAAENKARKLADVQTAELLGYDTLPDEGSGLALRSRREDMIAEIESSRDFVVLKAYDFQALWKHKKHKLLWVTRLSIQERGTNFAMVLPAMVSSASQYFGQDSRGLLRRSIPEGHVEIGDLKSLGYVPGR